MLEIIDDFMVVESKVRYLHLELFTFLVLLVVNFLKPLERLMTKRWMSLLRSSILLYSYRVRRECEDKLWRVPLEKGCLWLAPST
jgi:hypothetical protein